MGLRKLAKGPPPGQLHADTEARIEEIAATLRNCTFRNGVTLRDFAAKWGMSMDRVHEISALASKRVRDEVTDPERVAAKGFAMMERIAEDSLSAADDDVENASTHRSVALKAVDTWLTKSGVAVTKQSVTVTGGLTALTDEQLAARKAEVLAQLKGGEK